MYLFLNNNDESNFYSGHKIIKLLPTPFLHTPHGYLLGSTGRSNGELLTSILVLDMLTQSPFASKLSFQAVNWFSNPSKDSSIITKSSAYSSSHGHPGQLSWGNAFITIANSKDLRTEPWSAPTLTPNFLLKVLFIRTLSAASAYVAWTKLISIPWYPVFVWPTKWLSYSLCRKPFRCLRKQNRMAYFFRDIFLQLSKNEYGFHGTTARHETMLHLTDINWWFYKAFDDMFNDLHDVIQ